MHNRETSETQVSNWLSMWSVLIFVQLLSWTTAVHAGDENIVRLVSLQPDINLHQLEYLDLHSNILKRRAEIEQTTGHMLHVINQKRLIGLQVMPSGPIRYSGAQPPDWTYEAYVLTSIRSIIARGLELFPMCHFKDTGYTQPSVCFTDTLWKPFCKDLITEKKALTLLEKISDLPWTGNVTKDILTVKSIMYSNCGEHALAATLAANLIEFAPSNAFYRYLFSEVLSRREKRFIPDALGQIDLAIILNSSEPLYREKRISLFILNGQIKSAAGDVQWLRQQLDLYLRDKYCSYCVRKRVKKPVEPIAWRHWLTLALYNLVTHNTSQAERDLTIAMDLAAAAVYGNQSEVVESVTSTLQHLKAIALHGNGKFREAMDLAILNAHTDPSNVDAVLLVAQTLARAALYDRSLNMLNLALPLLDLFTLSPSSASLVQIFTDVSLIKRMFYQLRAWVYYRLGNVVESEQNAETCLDLLPSDALCSYVLSMCKLVTGRFVDAVKVAAPVLSRWSEPIVFSSAEFIHLSYLKEWARYLHSHFMQPMVEFHWLTDLSNQFKQNWVQSMALESVTGYGEQPGINSELPNFTASPVLLKSILFNSTTTESHGGDVFNRAEKPLFIPVNFSMACPSSWSLGLLDSGPCQSIHLKRLGKFLCKLDGTFHLFFPSSLVDSSPTVAPLNQRHRVSISLAALHSAESIRNFWCQRRRVSFSTCWSYRPNPNEPRLLQRTMAFPRADTDDWTSWSTPQCTHSTHSTVSTSSRRQCRSPTSEGPDWLVLTSATARFMQLADPSGAPAFWHSSDQGKGTGDRGGGDGDASTVVTEDGTPFEAPPHRPTAGSVGDCFDTSQSESLFGNPKHCENDWRTAAVRSQRYFIQHSQVVPDTLPYVPAVFRILSSFFRIRALLNPDSTGIFDGPFAHGNIFDDLPSHFPPSSRVPEQSTDRSSSLLGALETIVSYLDSLWREAGEHGLFDRHHRVALNLFVPGRIDLSRSASSELSAYRYLARVLLFEQDVHKNYMLSTLLLSNAQHQYELGAELDAAFEEFLIHGEKALASILAGSNSQSGSRRLLSPFDDRYLQDAVNSAFHWLYYWIVLKPLESVYSFHVGFGLMLGMLRALGVEPKASISVAERSLELEALFVGSPEAFASLCRSLLNLSWLSSSSLALTWQVAPQELIQHPKMFIEVLNLQAISECPLQ